ncbi:SMR family transporter [soil metagenome]
MTPWVYLAAAILSEVGGTISLRIATSGRAGLYAVTTVGYVASFVFLSLALHDGLGLGVAYGIWAAVGVALTALASRYLFSEALTPVMALGIALIVGGVLLVEVGGGH